MASDKVPTAPRAPQDSVIRVLDVVISAGSLVVASPVLAIAALGVKLSSPGPVMYRARRAGVRGEPFTMWKLRTMHTDSSSESRITSAKDHRIFGWGRHLRRLKIDELPQFVNVLRGEMSIVGPRPEDVTIVRDHFDDLMLESLSVRPGITGPGSLDFFAEEKHLPESLRDAEEMYLNTVLKPKVALDLVYARNRSVIYYFQIIVRTIIGIMGIRYLYARKQRWELGTADSYLACEQSTTTRVLA